MIRSIAPKAFALLLLAVLAVASSRFPINPWMLNGALAVYAVVLWIRPQAWLLLVPALLPVLDLAPWTGWFYVEELDLVLLTTAAVLYWRVGATPAAGRLPAVFAWMLGLTSVAFAVAAWRGYGGAQFDANSFVSYNSAWNSLREAKGMAWALVLLPLIKISAGPELVNVRRFFVPGMLAGLAGACLSVIWERMTFPGLLNFSSDYRPTGLFSAMHTGGAALDAYIAISFPFVAFLLAGVQSKRVLALGMGMLTLGCFVGMATFSRDIYMAFAASGSVLGLFALARMARTGTLRPGPLLAIVVILAICAYTLFEVFATGGYRTMAAALVLLVATVLLAGVRQRLTRLPLFASSAVGLVLLSTMLFMFFPGGTGISKGPYLAFSIAASVFAYAALALFFGPAARRGDNFAMAAGALPVVALCTALIAWHWGGANALTDTALLVALAVALFIGNRMLPQPLWSTDRSALGITMFAAIVLGLLIPMSSSYYMGSRFSTASDDLADRVRHWREAVDMMAPDLATTWLGAGLGKYPETFTWNNTHGETPGRFSYQTEGANGFLRLVGAQYAAGFGEVLRTLQHVSPSTTGRYLLSVDVRRTRGNASLAIGVCNRWMLYPENCGFAGLHLGPVDGTWQHYELELHQPSPPGPPGLFRPPTQLELSTDTAHAAVDIDNISLRDALTGTELVRNGSFSHYNNDWFFSSDRNHLPYHVKNFFVNTFFEQGWLGLIATALLFAVALLHLAVRTMRGDAGAGVYVAAITGFMTVGLFDSLFDVPRLTLLFFLVLCVALMTPALPTRRRPARTSARPVREPLPSA